MKGLKPCPFCGKTESVVFVTTEEMESCQNKECVYHYHNVGTDMVAVICSTQKGGCGGSGGYYVSEDDASIAWNRRIKVI